MTADETLKSIKARIDKVGDLPIFNTSLTIVRRVSSDPDAHSMELAQAVMKDVNLSVKLLALANSPYFNRGMGKIGSVTRAVVLLGFDTVKNLCLTLKLIESFQHQYPSVGLSNMVVRAYLTAGFVRDVAMKCGIKDVEESYICALLHGLGEIAVGYFLPDKFIEILTLTKKDNVSWLQAQKAVLGMSLAEVGQTMATTWEFPSKVISTLKDYDPKIAGNVKSTSQLNHALASFATQAVGSLYVEHGTPEKSLHELLGEISKAAGVSTDVIENSLNSSFKMSCDLAKEYGLDEKFLQPTVLESGDDKRDKLARMFSFYASSSAASAKAAQTEVVALKTSASGGNAARTTATLVPVTLMQKQNAKPLASAPNIVAVPVKAQPSITQTSIAPAAASSPTPPASRSNPTVQLEIIQEITALVTNSASLSVLFVKVLEGLQRGVGFDRAMLCLINPQRTGYSGRIAIGEGVDTLKSYFSYPINVKTDLFSKILMEGADLTVEDVNEPSWNDLIRSDFAAVTGTTSFIISSLRSSTKAVGFFYADNAINKDPITPEHRRGFLQFAAQARLALQVCG